MSSIWSEIDEEDQVQNLDHLLSLYGKPVPASLTKELDYLSEHYQTFIAKSPFVIVATSGKGGLDCSPRGDEPGFVRVHDEKTVLIPDRRGNNRLDSLRNLLEDPRISLLFLLPGIGTTLRINGFAKLVNDESLRKSFEFNGKLPATVIVVQIDRVYTQCPKALIRSNIWDPDKFVDKAELPSSGTILQSIDRDFDGEAYDKGYPDRVKKTIY